MSAVEAPRGDPDPANPSSLPFRDARSSAADSSSDMSVLDDSDDQSWHSVFDSTAWGSHGECQFSGEIEGIPDADMGHFILECSSEVDLESGDLEVKVHLGKIERDCRICHLELESGGGRDSDAPIQLGCCCRGDLGTAHKQCAETWFKIKGNTICEICGATAQNVASQQVNEPSSAVAAAVASSASTAPLTFVETRTIFHGRRIMNFLLACMLLAFAMSWLFHFKLMS